MGATFAMTASQPTFWCSLIDSSSPISSSDFSIVSKGWPILEMPAPHTRVK